MRLLWYARCIFIRGAISQANRWMGRGRILCALCTYLRTVHGIVITADFAPGLRVLFFPFVANITYGRLFT